MGDQDDALFGGRKNRQCELTCPILCFVVCGQFLFRSEQAHLAGGVQRGGAPAIVVALLNCCVVVCTKIIMITPLAATCRCPKCGRPGRGLQS